jgi:integrase
MNLGFSLALLKPVSSNRLNCLTDEEPDRLVSFVARKAASGYLVGKRDYAILLLFMATGMRRQEVLSLRGRDVKVDNTPVLTNRIKGAPASAEKCTTRW